MEKYDLVIIDAGPADYAAAIRSMDFRNRTLLVEKKEGWGVRANQRSTFIKNQELSCGAASFWKNLERLNIEIPGMNYKEIQDEVLRKCTTERYAGGAHGAYEEFYFYRSVKLLKRPAALRAKLSCRACISGVYADLEF